MLASCDVVVHSAATVAFDAPLDTAVEVNLLGPSRVAQAIESVAETRRRRDHPGAPPTHLVTVSTAYVAGTHQGDATETLATEALASGARARTHTTVTTEVNIDAEVTAARRLRDDLESASRVARAAGPAHQGGAGRAGCGGHPPLGRAGREAARRVGPDPARRARSGPGPGAGMARRLRLHQGPRASGPSSARTPISPSPSCGPRSSSRRWPSPGRDGSAASGWPSPSSSPTPGACCESSPASPKASSTSSPSTWWWPRIIAVAARRPRSGRAHRVPRGVERPEPPALRRARRPGAVVVHRAPALRLRRPAHHGPRVVVPRAGVGSSASCSGPPKRSRRPSGCSGRCRCAASGPIWRRRVEERRAQAERALGYTELYGAYTETEAHFRVDRLLALWERLSPADRASFCFDPGVISWPRLRPRRAPAVGGRARPGAVLAAPVDGGQPLRPGPHRHLVPRAPPGRLRPREHARGLQRGGVLRVAGEPPPSRRRAGRVHGPDPARGAGAARPRPTGPR